MGRTGGIQHERRSDPCATADAHSGPSSRQSPEPSSEESPPSPLVSLYDVTSHSPRLNASQQAKALRRWAILSVLSCDCRLLRAKGDGRRRFARVCGCHAKSREGECVLRKTKKTLREERAGRPSADRRETGGRRERTPGERQRGRGRPGSARLRPQAEMAEAQRRPTRDATNSTRSRQRGALRGRSGAERLPGVANWAGLRPAADLAVAARPSGRPSRPSGSASTVAPKHAARRQATRCTAAHCRAGSEASFHAEALGDSLGLRREAVAANREFHRQGDRDRLGGEDREQQQPLVFDGGDRGRPRRS